MKIQLSNPNHLNESYAFDLRIDLSKTLITSIGSNARVALNDATSWATQDGQELLSFSVVQGTNERVSVTYVI